MLISLLAFSFVCSPLAACLQYEKLSKLTQSSRIQFDTDELKAMVAALHFIFLNAAKYDVDATSVLLSELQQLGLPRDICTAIVRAFQQAKEQLREKLAQSVLARQNTSNKRTCLHASACTAQLAHSLFPTCSVVCCSSSCDWSGLARRLRHGQQLPAIGRHGQHPSATACAAAAVQHCCCWQREWGGSGVGCAAVAAGARSAA